MLVAAASIGGVTALGAIGFIELLHAVEVGAGLSLRRVPWWLLPLLPMSGALVAGVIIHFFAREAKGHGVPEVIDAIYRKGGRVRPRVAVAKACASAATIGSGGSAGAEGPIVQIGSALGSGMAQLLKLPRDQATTLLGCGAAAGIASVFNAPIAGVLFVLEILLRDFSMRTFIPIVVASVMSAAVTQAVLGENVAIFDVREALAGYVFTIGELPSYTILGLVCGGVAVIFIRMLYAAEDLGDRLPVHPIVRPVLGALALGLLGLAAVGSDAANGAVPAFFGNGYDAIRTLLTPASYASTVEALPAVGPEALQALHEVSVEPMAQGQVVSTGLLALLGLLGAKALATCLTLGSGGSGGVFAPSLFLGAVAGGAFGVLVGMLGLLPEHGSPATYALVGMASVVAATTHAPLTAILILHELTQDYYVLLPIMLAAVTGTLTAKVFLRDSIYSLKLRRRGVLLGTSADATLLRKLTAREITPATHVEVLPGDPLSRLLELQDVYQVADFVVVDAERRYLGVVTAQDLRTALIEREAIPYLLVEELMRSDLPTVAPDESLDRIVEKFARHDVASFALVEPAASGTGQRALGLITRARFMARYQQALRQPT